jgi:trk family potassium uptake protein
MTGIDEENLILSAYAKQQGVQKIITKMSRPALLKVFKGFDSQSVVTPKHIVANEIIQFVRSRSNTQGSNVEALYRLADNQVEALQFRVQKNSAICGIPLSELKTKSNLLIAFIVRGQQLIYPAGNDTIEPFDKVIVVTTEKDFDDINDILE